MTNGTDIPAAQGKQSPAQPTPPVPRRRRRLAKLRQVRQALAEVVNALREGSIEPGKARALVYALSSLAAVISDSDLEARVAALEERAKLQRR